MTAIPKLNTLITKIRRTGTEGVRDEELVKRIIMVNTLSLILSLIIPIVAIIFYALSWRLSILLPAIAEFMLACSPIVLNYQKRHTAAALMTYFVQCAASIYFGLLLGNVIELQAMVIFLFLITFLFFKEPFIRRICLIAAILILIIIEGNYYFNFIEQLPLSYDKTIIFKALTIVGVLLLIVVVGKPYVTSHDALHKAHHFIKMFTYKITHEIRNQLNAIYYIAQSIKREIRLDSNLKKIEPYIDLLFAAVGNTRNIINNVLDMSKIEEGKMEDLQEDAFLLRAYFERITAVHKVPARARNIQLKLLIDDRMPEVVIADSLKLNQVVTNLLNNAIKYADKRSVITLKVTRDNDTWNIQVINRGPGISPEKQQLIFAPFITAKNNKFIEGTGLGLYIIKNMIDAMQGSIAVESQPGGNTIFTVTLKLTEGQMEDVREEVEETEVDLGNIRILLADDNEMNNLLLSKFLTLSGCDVVTATNGIEAIQQLEKMQSLPDIILLDHHMPGMSGGEILKRLKKDPDLKHIPVIICTGSLECEDTLMESGAAAILVKPIDPKSLFAVISQHLPHINEANADLLSEPVEE